MVLFGSLLDQFVGCFVHASVLSTFHLDTVQFMNIAPQLFINGHFGLGQLFCL